MSGTRDENIFMARLAEQAERYEDMVACMSHVARMGAELNLDERNLLSVSYKNAVGARRQAWRAVNTLEQREAAKGPAILDLIKSYREKVESELTSKCSDILEILGKDLVPKASSVESKVFYLKLKGDYHRYLAEFSSGESHSRCSSDAHDSYQTASEVAIAEMAPTHPIRLGLALNFSVFYYEVYSSPEKACMLAKAAFDDAMGVMDNLDEDQYKDSAQIMQLLRDNLTLWTSDMQQDDGLPSMDGTAVEEL
jgi:14-3-3 protein epsilon|mmetsp:Transcript_15441/g.46328  ORF Transcript_15441/g.46328 Transcript_15441/m.46328 type:complete len:253 (-) Transcript_15441:85-843(-)